MAEDELSLVLTEFASTMVTNFPIQAILDQLVERIVDVLPVTAAGVTLISAGAAPRYVAASGAGALLFEQMQTELDQGPCVLAFTTGAPVLVEDLASDDRFPRFGPAAVSAGLAAVFAFPLHHGTDPIGALDLYRDRPGPLSEREVAIARTLADVAAAYVINALARADAGRPPPDSATTELAEGRTELARDLRAALRRGDLDVVYQPIVRSADGLLTGVEALLRWTDPDRGEVSPELAVAVAEESGLIDEVGAWVLERGCRDRSRWLRRFPGKPLDLAVNVSPHQLATPGFDETVRDALRTTDMDPAALVLELTENVFLEDTTDIQEVLVGLQQRAVRIALDDFGTGYSSLSYLRRVPVDIVKIDQGFVAALDRTPGGRAIVAAVTNLAHVLGLSVTAEGVETLRHRDEIRALGCDSSQGFFYSHPLSTDGVEALLGANRDEVVLPTASTSHQAVSSR